MEEMEEMEVPEEQAPQVAATPATVGETGSGTNVYEATPVSVVTSPSNEPSGPKKR